MSLTPFVSPGTRFEAADEKATYLPFAEIEGWELSPLAFPPSESTATRVVVPIFRSAPSSRSMGKPAESTDTRVAGPADTDPTPPATPRQARTTTRNHLERPALDDGPLIHLSRYAITPFPDDSDGVRGAQTDMMRA